MKRLVCPIISVLLCLALASCGAESDTDAKANANGGSVSQNAVMPSDTSGDAGTKAPPQTASAMRKIADAMEATGLFGDSMELHVAGDEYAADILEFTYGVTPGDHRIADYIISEQTSKEAYSFALITFEGDAVDADIAAVQSALEDVYLAGLRSALEVYNPEAYAMCGDALIERGKADIHSDGNAPRQADYVLLLISNSNSEARAALTDAFLK